jgi:hypothetical protein
MRSVGIAKIDLRLIMGRWLMKTEVEKVKREEVTLMQTKNKKA